ncbi:unnamed protein product [Psylliodes chrysocephalus]|uniref:Uncharacterized protein n=1 Tax=Psylliodes chrysocephalus TaxID=3402493 RepID=A0A9P0CHJ2_9CUCU|nr:unnamed protein product [Psylliodes chrysocephala]
MIMFKFFLVVFCVCAKLSRCQINLENIFENCRLQDPDSEECLKNGLNQLNPYFKEGLPDYGIESFDPFFASEVPYKSRTPLFNFNLILRNVSESGWTLSQVTKLRLNSNKKEMEITQSFPDKRLSGWYAFDGNILGRKIKNEGAWNLSLFNYVQTLTISRKPAGPSAPLQYSPIKVKCSLETCKNLEMHISNLAGGRTVIENMLDRVINTAWQPGFVILKPVINQLVGTAFTEIFNKNFQTFPFATVFKN